MFPFIKKALKGGVVTGAYPAQSVAVDSNFRGKPEHNSQQCIGCAACVNACPPNALSVELVHSDQALAWRLDLGRCIFCGRCQEVCPTAAITLTQQYELAVWDKADFILEACFPVCHCHECDRPFAVQKEIDYAISLIKHNGFNSVESCRSMFETCPECKRKQALTSSCRVSFTYKSGEAS